MTPRSATARSVVLLLALLATGLIAGFFYAYTCSVAIGLAEVGDRTYVDAMQSINATVRNALFAPSFFGAALLLALATALHARGRSPRTLPLAIATALYLGGGLLLTMAANVPLNDELARVPLDAGADVLARAREDYEGPWNRWNAVRTVLSTAALACVGWALLRPAARPAGSPVHSDESAADDLRATLGRQIGSSSGRTRGRAAGHY
jgi:uncharacterized membrane protein